MLQENSFFPACSPCVVTLRISRAARYVNYVVVFSFLWYSCDMRAWFTVSMMSSGIDNCPGV